MFFSELEFTGTVVKDGKTIPWKAEYESSTSAEYNELQTELCTRLTTALNSKYNVDGCVLANVKKGTIAALRIRFARSVDSLKDEVITVEATTNLTLANENLSAEEVLETFKKAGQQSGLTYGRDVKAKVIGDSGNIDFPSMGCLLR
ncbi:unnamed protein product [Echinostoma caproni]|uniref:SEA domain-containing protein n=1 Tax=Echinostoma caproni TaxID=27848 RepID=A0A183ANB2_9TREM|nr:unnamed protein product [Echinostoma caproni]